MEDFLHPMVIEVLYTIPIIPKVGNFKNDVIINRMYIYIMI